MKNADFWCERRDLNPHGVHHTHLKRARLPIPPLSHILSQGLSLATRIIITPKFTFVNTNFY